MFLDEQMFCLRDSATRGCIDFGCKLSHRYPGLKFDELNIQLTPDMLTENSSGLSLGDSVNVDCRYLIPWRYSTKELVESKGVGVNQYTQPGGRPKIFTIACFASVATQSKKSGSNFKGIFCVLAEDGCRTLFFERDEKGKQIGKVLLHHIGALKRVP